MPKVDYDDDQIAAAHSRMDRVERLLEKHNTTAPTIPQYDLQVPSGFTYVLSFPVNSVTLLPDTWHTVEINYVWDPISGPSFEPFVDGISLGVDTFTPGSTPAKNTQIALGLLRTDPDSYWCASDLRWGSTRGGTDLWSDILTSLPTVGPYDTVTNPLAIVVQNSITCLQLGNGIGEPFVLVPENDSVPDSTWLYLNVNVPAASPIDAFVFTQCVFLNSGSPAVSAVDMQITATAI